MNTDEKPRAFTISATGLPGLKVLGVTQPVTVGAASTRLVPFQLQVAADAANAGPQSRARSASHKIEIVVEATDDPAVARHEHSSFLFPR
jgi:hypothetical protein